MGILTSNLVVSRKVISHFRREAVRSCNPFARRRQQQKNGRLTLRRAPANISIVLICYYVA